MEDIIRSINVPDQQLQHNALQKLLDIAVQTEIIAVKQIIGMKDLLTDLFYSSAIFEENKPFLSDILSMVHILHDPITALRYRLGGNVIPLSVFGHQYIKKLLYAIYKEETSDEKVFNLIKEGIEFLISHNCECDAVDILIALGLERAIPFFPSDRVEAYILELRFYMDIESILVEYYMRQKNWVKMCIIMIKNRMKEMSIYENMDNVRMRKHDIAIDFWEEVKRVMTVCCEEEYFQILFVLGRCLIRLEEGLFDEIVALRGYSTTLKAKSLKVINRNYYPTINNLLHKDLELTDPFKIERFLKITIEKESYIKYAASIAIGNSFVHYGFLRDNFFFELKGIDLRTYSDTECVDLIPVIASLGLIKKNKIISPDDSDKKEKTAMDMYEDIIESFAFSESFSYKKSAALLAYSLMYNNYDSEHSLLALLIENLGSPCNYMKISSLLGIETLYAGSELEIILESLEPFLYSDNIETTAMTCFVLGSVFFGTMNKTLIDLFMGCIIERRSECDNYFFPLMLLGLSMLFLDCEEKVEPYSEDLREVGCDLLAKGFAYLGNGRCDVIETLIERLVEIDEEPEVTDNSIASKFENTNENVEASKDISENVDNKFVKMTIEEKKLFKSITYFSIALITLNDLHTRHLAKKIFIDNLPRDITNTIPLCLALLFPSEPDPEIIDAFSRSINSDNPITTILALAIIGAGTNNSQIVQMIEQQFPFHGKNVKILSLLRIALGIVALGKGTLSLTFFVYDKSILLKQNLIGMLGLFFLFINDNPPVLGKHSYLWFLLEQSIQNKHLFLLDKDLNIIRSNVRVGRPVPTAGVAGKPIGISGVVSHVSPVILGCDERAVIDDMSYCGFPEEIVVCKNVTNE